MTALMLAATAGQVDIVQLLLRDGADINAQDMVRGGSCAHRTEDM